MYFNGGDAFEWQKLPNSLALRYYNAPYLKNLRFFFSSWGKQVHLPSPLISEIDE